MWVRRMRHFFWRHIWVGVVPLLLGCSGGGDGSVADLIGEGGTCSTSADCEIGLECLESVCVAQDAVDGDIVADDTLHEVDFEVVTTIPDCTPDCSPPEGVNWVPIEGGSFVMGCSPDDGACMEDEKPAHTVTLSSFQILETEVTEAQYEAIMEHNPSCDYGDGGGPFSPVECVHWFNAKAFCEAIGGRLPTEAEWEYVAPG